MAQASNYTQGYSKATVSSHAARTIGSDAAFLIPHIRRTDKVLDVGCGPGTITAGFADIAGEVVGIDISADVIKTAEETVEKRPNLSFRTGDLLKGLDWIPDGTFDVVYASQLFPHLPTADMRGKAMAEMRRVLRDGGILATRTAADLHWYPLELDLAELWNKRMNRGFGTKDFAGPVMPALYRAAGFERVLVSAGTTVFATEEERARHAERMAGRLEKGEALWTTWKSLGLSEEEIAAVKQTVDKWAKTEDAWYVAVQAEVIGWK